MAKAAGTTNPALLLGDATRFADLRQRLLFLAGALIVYRIGTFIPVPGIDPVALSRFFEQQSGTILSMFNMFSGGALRRWSIFALGIMPYISASIILQMGTHVIPALGQLRKEARRPPQDHAIHALRHSAAVAVQAVAAATTRLRRRTSC
jgi:preprotein translocase subunit SecY